MADTETSPKAGQVATYTVNSDKRFVGQYHSNIRSDLIEITHDKLENVLLKFYKHHTLRSSWFNPLSLAVGVTLTLSTAEFKVQALGLKGEIWQAVFLIALVASVVWLLIILIRLMFCWKETSIESLINKIKNNRDGR